MNEEIEKEIGNELNWKFIAKTRNDAFFYEFFLFIFYFLFYFLIYFLITLQNH